MDTSYNGWPVLGREDLVWFTATFHGGTQRFAAANHDVAVIARHLLERYDAEVEPITGPVLDDWSYAPRPVRGATQDGTNWSCHASATAWDVNALQHGRGRRGTMTALQVKRLRAIYEDIRDDARRPILRWGGDYVSAPPDEMHHEILPGVTKARVAQAARRIQSLEDAAMATAEQNANALLSTKVTNRRADGTVSDPPEITVKRLLEILNQKANAANRDLVALEKAGTSLTKEVATTRQEVKAVAQERSQALAELSSGLSELLGPSLGEMVAHAVTTALDEYLADLARRIPSGD